jgi:hypothetical protein
LPPEKIAGLVRSNAPFCHTRQIDVRVTESVIIRRGTIATDVPARAFIRGMGEVMLSLRVDAALIETWRTQGVTQAPFLKNHGLNADGFFNPPAVENDALGHLDAFAVETKDGRAELAVDFHFHLAYLLDKPVLNAAARTSPVIPTSVGFSFDAATDLEVLGTHDNGLPLVRANFWRLAEGSITTVGLDQATHIRTSDGPVSRAEFETVLARLTALTAKAITESVETADPEPQEEISMTEEEIRALVQATTEQVAEEAASKALEAARSSGPAPSGAAPAAGGETPPDTTDDPAGEADPWEEIRAVAIEHEIAPTEIGEMLDQAGADIGAFRVMVKSAVAIKQETATPAPDIEAGTTAVERSLQSFIAATMARGLKDKKAKAEWAEKARKLDSDWEKRDITRTCQDILLASGKYEARSVYEMDRGQLVETTQERTKQSALNGHMIMKDNGRYMRTASGGLTPADLPSAYQEIVTLSVQIGFVRFVIPFSQVSIQQTVEFFSRPQRIVDVTLALNFRPLEEMEGFLNAELREQESTFEAFEYGHRYPIGTEALVNQPDRLLAGIPSELGQAYAAGENQLFVLTATSAGNFTAATQIAGNPLDYGRDVQRMFERSWLQNPVNAAAGDERGNTSFRTRVLQPTAAIWGSSAWFPWLERTNDLEAGMALDRDEAAVHDPHRTLRENSHLALDVAFNQGIAWPGPESGWCPMRHGGVLGREGLRIVQTSRGIEQGERDHVVFNVTKSFGVQALSARTRYMYELTDNSLANPAP